MTTALTNTVLNMALYRSQRRANCVLKLKNKSQQKAVTTQTTRLYWRMVKLDQACYCSAV